MPLPEDVVADDPRYASEHPSHHNQIHAAINDLEALAGTLSDVETTTGSQGKVDTHSLDQTSVHGITDTAQLAFKNTTNTFTQAQTFDSTIAASNVKRGTGTPEGSVTGVVGDVYQRTNGGTSTTLYIKESGTGNTGWIAVAPGGGGGGTATALDATSAAAVGTDIVKSKLTADSQYRFTQNADGSLEWGAGGATAPDTNLFRSAANTIRTDDSLQIKGPNPWVDVKAFGAVGDGTTDDTAAIQAAIDSIKGPHDGLINGGTIFFPKGTYACSGTLSLYQSIAIVLRGPSTATYGGNAVPAAVLKYTGTGTRFIDVRSTTGFRATGLKFTYSNSGFTGHVMDFDSTGSVDASYGVVEDCQFWYEGPGGVGDYQGPAATQIYLFRAITISINRCHIGRAQVGIKGLSDVGEGYSNAVQIHDCNFRACSVSAVANAAQTWVIDGCTFEGGDGQYGDLRHGAYWDTRATDIGPRTTNLSFKNCWMGDLGATQTEWIGNNNATIIALEVAGNFIMDFGVDLNLACKGVSVSGNYFGGATQTSLDFNGGEHVGVAITGNCFESATPVAGTANITRLVQLGNTSINGESLITQRILEQAVGAELKFEGPTTSQPGITLNTDTNLYRSAANTLASDDVFIAGNMKRGTGTPEGSVTGVVGDVYQRTDGGSATAFYIKESGAGNTGWVPAGGGGATTTTIDHASGSATTVDVVKSKLTADTQYQFIQNVDGKLEWGAGGASAVDTNLFRSAASTLMTDDDFLSNANIAADYDGSRVQIGNQGPGGEAGFRFRSGLDVNLYAASGTELKTDDSFTAGAGLKVGTGTLVTSYLSATATLDFPSIAAQDTAELTITVTGSASGDQCYAAPATGIEADLVWSAWVSAANTVTVRIANPTAGAIDPASRSWRASVIKH